MPGRVLVLLLLLHVGAAQTSADGSIAVLVVADDGFRTPLAAADVVLNAVGSSGRFRRALVTGDDGACVFTRLPAGAYVVRGAKADFVTTPFGASADDAEPTPIVVTGNARVAGIEMRLPPGGAITGVVRDAAGAIAPHAAVSLMEFASESRRVARISDAANVGGVIRTETDNSGVYRLHGLPRGAYIVQAVTFEAGAAVTMTRGSYPNAADAAAASSVYVAPGEVVAGIDVQMHPVMLVNVSGSVSWPAQQPRPAFKLLVLPEGLFANPEDEQDARAVLDSPVGLFTNPVNVRANNTFSIGGVPAGQYEMWLRSTPANTAAMDDPGPAFWGRATIAVGDKDVTDVTIAPHSSTSVTGRIEIDGAAGVRDRRGLTGAFVALVPIETPGVRSRTMRVPAPIEADGTFRIIGVTPGRYTFEVSFAESGWSLTSVGANARDLFEAPFDITDDESIGDVVVEVTNVRQVAAGILRDQADRPVGGMRVVIFPSDRRLWMRGSRRIRSVKTATDGTFVVSDLPVGEYRVGALTTTFDAARADLSVLDALAPASVPFALQRGANLTLAVRLAR